MQREKLGAKRSYLIREMVLSPISWPCFANVLDIYQYVDVDVFICLSCMYLVVMAILHMLKSYTLKTVRRGGSYHALTFSYIHGRLT